MKKNSISLVILAGGESSRMKVLGRITPKPLMSAFNEPLIVRHVRHAKEANLKKIIISTNNLIYLRAIKCLRCWNYYNIKVVNNPDHKKGSLPALLRIMKSLKTDRLIMSFVDIFFLNNPYKKIIKATNENEYLLGVSLPFNVKELTMGGIIFLNRDKTIKKIIESPLKNNKNGLRWNGLAYFDTSQKAELETFLQNNPKSSPEGDFFEYLRRKMNIFNICMCSDFVNINKPEDLLLASLYRYTELHQTNKIKSVVDEIRKYYLLKLQDSQI